jgi:hypothetical protein
MDDKTLRRKLNQFARLGNEIDAEAKRRFEQGFLFHEADGTLHIMDGDADGRFDSAADRQEHIQMTADERAAWGAGAW